MMAAAPRSAFGILLACGLGLSLPAWADDGAVRTATQPEAVLVETSTEGAQRVTVIDDGERPSLDLDGDRFVTIGDLTRWGGLGWTQDARADLDGDGAVTAGDRDLLAAHLLGRPTIIDQW